MNRRTLGPNPEWIIRHHRDRTLILLVGVLAVIVGAMLIVGIAVTL